MKKKLLSLLMITTAMLFSACGSSDSTQVGGDVANVDSVGHESSNTVTPSNTDVPAESTEQSESIPDIIDETTAEAWGTCGADLKWYHKDGILVIRGTGEMDNWNWGHTFFIDFEPTTPPWTDIADNIQEVIIENGCTSIGTDAFDGLRSLNKVTIPDSVMIIGDYAFNRCESLNNIDIPNNVTSIGENAFCKCENITSIKMTDSVTTIGAGAFRDCKKLTNIDIPNNITVLEPYTFDNCRSLSRITIPDSVTTIGDNAFEFCVSLTSIVIPDSVTTIGAEAFSSCNNLTSINLSNNITVIEKGTFISCERLTSITIPDGVTIIGKSAFSGCESLGGSSSSIKIPESVTKVESGAFTGIKIVDLYIPNADAEVARDVVDDKRFYIIGNTEYMRNGNAREGFRTVEHYIDEDGNDSFRDVR